MRAIEGGYSNFDSPDKPAAVYQRGQTVQMKYTRNNHSPGGFIRLTLVTPEKMMDKNAHAENAFYYTCWGANPQAAAANEMEKDEYGFSFIGSDGEQHSHPKGYYVMDVKIPSVVPDGKYVLGWVWYGGGGGPVEGNVQQEPMPYGYFSDYWSCAYVEISGGAALESRHTPVFNNDMSRYSDVGCMSANDAPGVCSYEPCKVDSEFQAPRPFKDGNVPDDLTPEQFGGVSPAGGDATPPAESGTPMETPASESMTPMPIPAAESMAPMPTPAAESMAPVGTAEAEYMAPMATSEATMDRDGTSGEGEMGSVSDEMMAIGKRACRCLAAGERCWRKLAGLTGGKCVQNYAAEMQPEACGAACCSYCAEGRRGSRWLCAKEEVGAVCGM